jgi:hypothetical protein
MTEIEILQELKKLTSAERLAVAEAALRLLREDLLRTAQLSSGTEVKQELAKAAQALLPEYQAGGDLTAFTVLDNEDFCAKG